MPRDVHNSNRRRRKLLDMPRIFCSPPTSPSPKKSNRSDANVLRGAEIIRNQIRKQLGDEDASNDKHTRGEVTYDMAGSYSSDDDFSDPWATHNRVGSHRSSDAPGTKKSSKSSVSSKTRDGDSTLIKVEVNSLGGDSSTASFPTRGDASEWADIAMEDAKGRRVAPPSPPKDGTPVTQMGRKKNLNVKKATYLVEPLEYYDDDEASSQDFTDDDYYMDEMDLSPSSYLPSKFKPELRKSFHTRSMTQMPRKMEPMIVEETEEEQEQRQGPPPNSEEVIVPIETPTDIPSPMSVEYKMLLKDPAYIHAQKAGCLWQSIVGQHIRFPSQWWNGARSPPMGSTTGNQKWQYFGRHKIRSNPILKRVVPNRAAPGRLLLHIIVQDLMTWKAVQDIAIGCFHPNARGIRKSKAANPQDEGFREIWVGVRNRGEAGSVVDPLLSRRQSWDESTDRGPLGPKQRVTNHNVRGVFGEKAPLETVFVPESKLYEILSCVEFKKDACPSMVLLEEFVFS